MHDLLKPYKPEEKSQILKEMESNSLIKGEVIALEDMILFTTMTPIKEADEKPDLFKKGEHYIRYTFSKLRQVIQNGARFSQLPRFCPELLPPEYKFPSLINFELKKKKYYLPLSEVLSAAEARTPLTKAIFTVTKDSLIPLTPEEHMKNVLLFLKDMSEYILWKKHPDFKKEEQLKELTKDFKGDEKFVKYWIKERKITTEQLCCKHNTSDQYANDGQWYNSVDICKKCLFNSDESSFESPACEAAFKAWSAARKAFMV